MVSLPEISHLCVIYPHQILEFFNKPDTSVSFVKYHRGPCLFHPLRYDNVQVFPYHLYLNI